MKTMWQAFKAFGLIRSANNVRSPAKLLADFFENISISAIRPNQFQAAPAMIMNAVFDFVK
jgi:hypothetical protein